MSKEPLIGPRVAYPTPWRLAEENQYGHVIACSVGHQAASVGDPELGELICDLVNAAGEDERLVDRLRTQLHECAGAAENAAKEWKAEIDRRDVEHEAFRAGMARALGFDRMVSNSELVLAAERSWHLAQGVVEGLLADDGVTELPELWTQDGGPPSEDYTGDWAPGDLVEYDDHGCTFRARLIRPDGGRNWRATVETFEGRHDPSGVFAIGTEVSVVYGYSVKIQDDGPPTQSLPPVVDDPAPAEPWRCGSCKTVNAPDAKSCEICLEEAGPVVAVGTDA